MGGELDALAAPPLNPSVSRMGFGSTVLIVLLICLAGVAAFFVLVNRSARPRHTEFGPGEVESALQCVLDDTQYHDDFDLFLTWPINDPYLDSIRRQCQEIARTSAPARPGEDMSENGKERIRAILRDLRGRDRHV